MTTKSVSTSDWIPNPENASVLKVDGSEIANFEDQVKLFQAGEKDEIEFLRFRLRQGVYGQRQPDRQMIRVKIPFGGLTADQMDVLGEVAEIYTPLKKGHFTTRENVQYHHVPLAETPELLRLLGDSGLSTREACGNTVRNVVAHPSAGVSKDEVFDVTPYAAAYSRYFLRHPTTQNMPRKSKVAFSGSEKDEAMVLMHDVGLVARIRDGKRGFKIVVGGGLSTKAIMAKTLSEFVPVEDYLLHCEAVLRIFNRQDEERKSIAKARIKFTIDRLGIDKFKEMVDEELLGDWAKKQIDTDSLMFTDDEESDAPGAPTDATPEPADGQADHAAYSENHQWVTHESIVSYSGRIAQSLANRWCYARGAMSDRRIRINADGVTLTATLNQSPTATKLWAVLPIVSHVQTWGDEIYFSIPLQEPEADDAQETVD